MSISLNIKMCRVNNSSDELTIDINKSIDDQVDAVEDLGLKYQKINYRPKSKRF